MRSVPTLARVLACLGLLALVPLGFAEEIRWSQSYSATLKKAGETNQVVFLAVNMDGERANDFMAEKVYTDARIEELAGLTLNLVASAGSHSKPGRSCSRFGGVECSHHQSVEKEIRGKLLKPDSQGRVVAPQHVFLDPQGDVILSVPYQISRDELEWCFVAAIHAADPESKLEAGESARAPKRLIKGQVYDLSTAQESAPMPRDEALELIATLKKKAARGGGFQRELRQLAMADEKEAREFILSSLRTTRGRRAGEGNEETDRRTPLMRWIGENSPESYWEVVAEFLDDPSEPLRAEAIVATEQLGSPKATKPLLARLRKEKDEYMRKNLLRALGTCGADDKRARKELLKAAASKKESEDLLRRNAIVALGWLAHHEDVREFLASHTPEVATVLAMGLTRDASWIPQIKALAKVAPAPLFEATQATLWVLQGADLRKIQQLVTETCDDRISRKRLFGQ